MAGDRLRGLVEVGRPGNAIVAGVLTFIGAYVAGGVVVFPVDTGAAVVATVCATAAGNAVNDYFDREIDRINAPRRPIPRGAITPREAISLGILLFGIAVTLALTLPLLAIVIAVINLICLLGYTQFLKGRPGAGNATVAYLGGSTFLFGGAAVGNVRPTLVLFVLAALSTFTREVVKDIEDLEGDIAEGLTTLPVAVGKTTALHIGTVVLIIAVMVSPLPYVTGIFGRWYLVSVIPAILIMLASAYLGYRDPSRSHRLLKLGMVLAAIAFIIGRYTA